MADTLILRCFAALLIMNSHLEALYPLPWLAADGLLGNSLFFLLSGYGLVLSDERAALPFSRWYARRARRIVPPFLVVMTVIYLAGGGWARWTGRDYVNGFLLAGPYTFVREILFNYAIFYWVLRPRSPRPFARLFWLLFVPYAAVPSFEHSRGAIEVFHWIYYFQVMVLGGWLAHRRREIAPGGPRAWGAIAAVGMIYVAVRLGLPRWGLEDYFFLPHLLMFPILLLLMSLARSGGVTAVMGSRRIAPLVTLVGGMTLEAYLVHALVLDWTPVARLAFPLNVVVFFALSLATACLLAGGLGRLKGARRGAAPSGSLPAWLGLARAPMNGKGSPDLATSASVSGAPVPTPAG